MRVESFSACLLVASVRASSDTTLSKLLGLGSMDMFMNLEQKQQDNENSLPDSNEMDDNKIHF